MLGVRARAFGIGNLSSGRGYLLCGCNLQQQQIHAERARRPPSWTMDAAGFFFFLGGHFCREPLFLLRAPPPPPPPPPPPNQAKGGHHGQPQPHTWPWSATWYCHCHCHAALAPAGLLQLEHLESQVPPRPKGFWCLALGREPVSNQGGGERGRIRRTTHHRPPEARLASQPPAGSALRRQLRAPVVGSASASSALIFFSALDPLYAVSVHKPASQSRTRTRS
jgi:hypothetical protein